MGRKRVAVWIIVAAVGVAATALVLYGTHHWRSHWTVIQGAVIRRDPDTRKEQPIAGVSITASRGAENLTAQSDASGYFQVSFPEPVLPGEVVTLRFRHPDYQDVDLSITFQLRSLFRQLVIAKMAPNPTPASTDSTKTQLPISNIKVRYTENSQSEENIGSMVKTFQVVNRGDVPCQRQSPCSPDGYWKATTEMVELDAGSGNEFHDARASCIAGPCPFTQINLSGFVNEDSKLTVKALDWSDTATFLVEAEVFHTAIESNVRESYPFIFGTALNFTVPASAEGVSIEAELNGEPMVFPLGPDLYLSWATCSARSGSEAGKSTVYQCELKPEFRFQ